MIRIIVRTDDAGMAANVGGSVLTTYHTIDVDLPELEELIKPSPGRGVSYTHTQVVGVEVRETPTRPVGDGDARREG